MKASIKSKNSGSLIVLVKSAILEIIMSKLVEMRLPNVSSPTDDLRRSTAVRLKILSD